MVLDCFVNFWKFLVQKFFFFFFTFVKTILGQKTLFWQFLKNSILVKNLTI